jgi:glycosyltransferase involved in cell wall biosynthesis
MYVAGGIMRFSACYIVKNEAGNLKRSIDSLKAVVDDIVVVDTGSTDNTVEVAQECGARIGRFEWIGDFSAARNYALSLVDGEIVIFPDADEWFVPALDAQAKADIEAKFADSGIEVLQVPICNLNDQGAVLEESAGSRIFRGGRGLRFSKKIHEVLSRANGAIPEYDVSPGVTLHHTGYVADILPIKIKRNIAMLEEAAENAERPVERNLQRFYLVREYKNIGDGENALRCLLAALREPELIRQNFAELQFGFAQLVYKAMSFAALPDIRPRVSRREIHKRLVETLVTCIPKFPGVATIELFYGCLFDIREDRLLAELKPAIARRRTMGTVNQPSHLEAEMVLNQRAAEASYRRGLITQAMDYAVESFKDNENNNAASLHTLLLCMRGIGAADIIAFLNSQFDQNNNLRLRFLTEGSRMHGFRDVHAYYLNKLIKAGLATQLEYLYLLVLYGKSREAASAAVDMRNGRNDAVMAECIFLAAVCADDEAVYRENEGALLAYGPVLKAYFAGGRLDASQVAEAKLLARGYGDIALAAGLERADKLRGIILEAHPLLCYQIRVGYCVDNGLYELALEEEMPDEGDAYSLWRVSEALAVLGRCEEALGILERAFGSGVVDDKLLRMAMTVADRSSGALKARAAGLFEKYAAPYDMLVDLSDMLASGFIGENTDNKKQKAYRSATRSRFLRQLEDEKARPRINGLAEACDRAAAFFAERGMPATAMEHARAAYAMGHAREGNRARMAEFFRAAGNAAVAQACMGLEA